LANVILLQFLKLDSYSKVFFSIILEALKVIFW
jgi:hypothetical protein